MAGTCGVTHSANSSFATPVDVTQTRFPGSAQIHSPLYTPGPGFGWAVVTDDGPKI